MSLNLIVSDAAEGLWISLVSVWASVGFALDLRKETGQTSNWCQFEHQFSIPICSLLNLQKLF